MAKQKTKPDRLLLGIFIGLALGLGIAIIVALIVTKTASKVTSKYSQTEKAPERDTSKPLPDPNKPLYAQTGSGEVISEKDINTTSVSKPKQAESKAVKSGEKDDAEVKQRKEWRYFLQVGAYLNEDEAENVRAQLAFMGMEASISERWSSQGTLHRVRTGPFLDADEMNYARRRLIQSGFKPSVIRLEIKNDKKEL